MNLLAALLLLILPGAAEAQVFDPAKVGPPLSNSPVSYTHLTLPTN